MSTRSIIAYKTKETTEKPFETGSYVHWDGYPTEMGKSWFTIARHEMFGGNLASMVEYFIHGNPVGWSIVDRRRDITKKPISVEMNQKLFGYDAPDKPKFTGSYDDKVALAAFHEIEAAWEATAPLVSFRARRWDIMAEFGYTNEADAAKDPRCTESWRWETDNIMTPESMDMGTEWMYVIDIDARTMTIYSLYPEMTERAVVDLDGVEPDWEAIEGRGEE